MTIKAKEEQILSYKGARLYVTLPENTTIAGAKDITSALTAMMSTAGRGNVALPLQVAVINPADQAEAYVPGIVVDPAFNKVSMNYGDGDAIKIGATTSDGIKYGDVYGRITFNGGVWTVSPYETNIDDGTETLMSGLRGMGMTTGARTLVLGIPVIVSWDLYDPRWDIANSMFSMAPESITQGTRRQMERLPVTTMNNLPALSRTAVGPVTLFVNHLAYSSAEDNPAFGVTAGLLLTWNPASAGFNLTTTDEVIAEYFY